MKKNSRLNFCIGFIALVLLLFSCDKEEKVVPEEPSAALFYNYKIVNLNASVVSEATESGKVVAANSLGSLNWNGGYINSRIDKLDAKKDGRNFSFYSPLLVYYALYIPGGSILGAGGTPHISYGKYDEVELDYIFTNGDRSLGSILKGTYTNLTGTKSPVEFRFSETAEVIVKSEPFEVPGTITGNGNKFADITFQLNKLVANIPAADFDLSTRRNDTILITSTHNQALYNKIKANLQIFISFKVL